MSDENTEQLEFNDDVIEKMKRLLEESAEGMKKGIREMMVSIEDRNQRLRLTVADEMYRMPNEMQCAVFEHMSDLALHDVIMNDEILEKRAGYVLRRRRHRLGSLQVGYSIGNEFNRLDLYGEHKRSVRSAGCKSFQNIKMMSCPILMKDYVSACLYVILAYYDISETLIQGTTEDLPLEDWLGTPLDDKSKRIKTDHLYGDMKELLPWVLPTIFEFGSPSKQLIDDQGQLVCLDGVERVRLTFWIGSNGDIVDDVMLKFRGPVVVLWFCSLWSQQSFNAVLTAHANGDDSSPPRYILCVLAGDPIRWPHAKSEAQWTEMFTDWHDVHLSEFGEPKRTISHQMDWDNGRDAFRINLL